MVGSGHLSNYSFLFPLCEAYCLTWNFCRTLTLSLQVTTSCSVLCTCWPSCPETRFYLDISCAPSSSGGLQCLRKKLLPFIPQFDASQVCSLSLSAPALSYRKSRLQSNCLSQTTPTFLYPALALLLCGTCPSSQVWGNSYVQHGSLTFPTSWAVSFLAIYPKAYEAKPVLPGAHSPKLGT